MHTCMLTTTWSYECVLLLSTASVDTLLEPEAPLALRLSGQLLLGVVRIYERKVGGAQPSLQGINLGHLRKSPALCPDASACVDEQHV